MLRHLSSSLKKFCHLGLKTSVDSIQFSKVQYGLFDFGGGGNNNKKLIPMKSTTYPYVFGGITAPFQNQVAPESIIKSMFPPETEEGFKQAFRFVLGELEAQDRQSLQKTLEPNLTKNMKFREVQLINAGVANSEIQIAFSRCFRAFGVGFIRKPQNQLNIMDSTNDNSLYLNMEITKPDGSSIQKYITQGFPILIAFEVLFRSSMKLVQAGQLYNEHKEVHSLQFQVEGKIDIAKYMNLVMQKGQIKSQNAIEILKDMVGENYEWKIGDIDQTLEGNLTLSQ